MILIFLDYEQNLGTKFPTRSLGVHLSLKTKIHVHSQHTLENSYMQVFFKVGSSKTHTFQ